MIIMINDFPSMVLVGESTGEDGPMTASSGDGTNKSRVVRRVDRVGAVHRMPSSQKRTLLVITFSLVHVVEFDPLPPSFFSSTTSDV